MKFPKVLGILVVVIIAFSLGYIISKQQCQEECGAYRSSEADMYPYLARRIFIDNPNDFIVNFVPLRVKLREYDQKSFNPIGIYFQYIPTGVAIGVNETTPFVSASLLKLPTVMLTYKRIEEGKISKNQLLTIKEHHLNDLYGDLWQKGVGAQITVEEAIEKSMIDSDNTAHNLLYELTGGAPLEVFRYLDIPSQIENDQAVVTTRNYSSILRSLFFSAYLSVENSNNILNFLTQAKHSEALRASVPESIEIASKIGVFEDPSNPGLNTYGQCGIFYVPNRPYVLCVIYNGEKEDVEKKIRDISNMTYEYISNYKNDL